MLRSRSDASTSSDDDDASDPYAWAKSMKNVREEVSIILNPLQIDFPSVLSIGAQDAAYFQA